MKYILLFLFPILLYASDLSYKMSYYEDSQLLDFQDIRTQKFTYYEGNSLFKGYNFHDIWVKIELKNRLDKNMKCILSLNNATLDYVDFYEHGKLKVKTGDHRKNANKEILDIYFSFNIDVAKRSEQIYYLRLKTTNAFMIDIKIQEQKKYLLESDRKKMFLLFFFGFILSIIIYNSFIFFIAREKTYFFYVMFQLSTLALLLSLSGLGYYLVWQDNSTLNEIIIKSFDDLALIFALLFTRSFLDVAKRFPKLNRLIYVTIALSVYIMLTPWQYHSVIVKPVMLGNLFVILYTSIYAVYKKVNGAVLFFFAWLILMSGSLLALFKSFGLVEVNFLTTWSIYLGAMVESVVFSIALAYRIKKLKEEKTKALELSKIVLDKRVQERTKELNSLVKQKEILIKEVNHRVKNNLQIITSFITILSIKEKNRLVQNNYDALNNKIQAIASLHEFFYKQEDTSSIDVKEYFDNFVSNLYYLHPKNKIIEYKLNIEKVNLDLDKLTTIGLILNELITNSMKYAFVNLKVGTIEIDLTQDDNIFVFKYRDDGIGFDLDATKFSSLGLKLVNKLATKQLNATMEFEKKNGSSFTFSFK